VPPAPSRNARGQPEFRDKVEVAKEYIRAGDAFQIVVSQRFSQPSNASSLAVYRALRMTNPSPYMYLLNIPAADSMDSPGFSIVGSSPEALVKLTGDEAMLHPIAGTRPRGATPDEDAELVADLLADPKERAEHLMLVDLGRNDLGSVCTAGTVSVVEFMQVEQYSHVHHIVSTVVGRLQAGRSAYDLLSATFPAGTLSGAPKPRAMEIIDELEDTRGDCTPGVSATSTWPVTWTRRSPSARPCCATGWRTSRPGRASWPTPIQWPKTKSARTRPLRCCGRWRSRRNYEFSDRGAGPDDPRRGVAVLPGASGQAASAPGLVAALIGIAAIWLASGRTRFVLAAVSGLLWLVSTCPRGVRFGGGRGRCCDRSGGQRGGAGEGRAVAGILESVCPGLGPRGGRV
jgi:hypothetical protein